MAYTYWRLNFTTVNYGRIQEIEMRASRGGSDQCTGGTPLASSEGGGGVVAHAFDNTGFMWTSSASGGSHWVQYQFASAVDVDEIALQYGNVYDEAPSFFDVQASNDGSTWTTIHAGFATSERHQNLWERFWLSGAKTYWRINISQNNNGSDVEVAEMEWRTSISGTDQATGNASYGTGAALGFRAFADDGTAAHWTGSSPPAELWYHFDDDKECVEYTIQASTTPGRAPKAWTVEYSADGINWTVVDTVTGETSWGPGEIRTFVIGARRTRAYLIPVNTRRYLPPIPA